MSDDDLEAEVGDLLRYGFAATAEEVADALGVDVERAARAMERVRRPVVAAGLRRGP